MRRLLALLIVTLAWLPARSAAISITAGPTLTTSNITFETHGTPDGTTVQFTLDSAGQAQVTFFQVSPVDSSLTQVASITRTFASAGAQSIFWNALWPIGTDFGRHNGTFSYQVTPSTGATAGTALPPLGDSSASFTINSMDIHNLTVTSSLDASGLPTSPYVFSFALAKAGHVTAQIINSSNTVVRTIAPAQPLAGESVSSATITWNGLDEDGHSAPIGNYTVTIAATDLSSADQAISRTQNFSVLSLAGAAADPQRFFESNVYVFPNPVRNGHATFQLQAARDGANLSLKIYTITGTLVREETFPGIAAGNNATFSWDATNQSGAKVGRGLYYYVAREEDPAGTLQTVKKLAVIP